MNMSYSVQSIYHTVLGIVLYCIFVLSPVNAETTNCTAITSLPYTISNQGVYCLTGHLSTNMTLGRAITINANNVTLDLNGYKLGGLAAGAGTQTTGIYSQLRKNITIRNGTIRGFLLGIFFQGSSPYTTSQGHIIEDIRAERNTSTGFAVKGRGNILRRNQVISTGGSTVSPSATGIMIYGPGVRVLDNDIIGTAGSTSSGIGLRLLNAPGSVVKGNSIDDTSGGTPYAVLIQDSSDVLARANRITNTVNGLYYAMTATGKYMDNLTSNVTTSFSGGTAVGTNN